MKILPKSKKAISPPPQVNELISSLLTASNEQLVEILKSVDTWKWPRSDLNAWVKVLNKLDDIMDGVIREYNVEVLQLQPFSPFKKDLLSEILRFERLLLENSTNRKTFSSYDRLNSLLSTSDLDILILTLNLLLRPSQQYSAQLTVSHALSISTSRLQSLAKRWPHLREHGIGLVDLVGLKAGPELEGVPADAREVNFNFYRTEIPAAADAVKTNEDTPETPASSPRKPSVPVSAPSSSAIHLRIDESALAEQPVMNVLANAIQTHSVPESETFELLCRIRTATSLSAGRKQEREKLVVVRLLAIAIFGHTHTESQATSALFLYEPDLVGHIAELLQVDRKVPIVVQTAAIAALDALARYKSKVQEVLMAVNAGVNHGILMALVRNMVSEVANPESKLPHSFIEALLSFITYIASHASGGNMVVGAGLIPLLIQVMENKSPFRLPVISKTMQLVDNVLYSFTNAFSLFCASHGVDILVDRIEYEIDYDIKEYASEYQSCAISGTGELPIQRIAVLKHILRSMHRMMQSSGTAEGLRGLIDMTLLKSIKKIIEYRGLFGPNIFPLAINIMSTFVHNEPTSLAIIQEAGLPEMFYKAIEIGIEPSIEVIQAIPNAIGALCLNDAGQTLLSKRPSIIPGIFSIFTSEKHLKVLVDKENAVIIGTAVDELIRHHPSLKTSVFEALKSTLSSIEDLGSSYVPTASIKQWYQLLPVAVATSVDSDVTMQDGVQEIPTDDVAGETISEPVEADDNEEEDNAKTHDNIVVSYIDVVGRFLEGFFQHPPHCKDFVTSTDGLERFGRLTGLPCLPYDFANSVASDSMVQVLRTMAEVATVETLVHLSNIVEASLNNTKFIWDPITESSKLLPFVDLAIEDEALANEQFRSLVVLHIRITLLSDVFATAGQAQGRAAIGLLQTMMEHTPLQVLINLGTLHRASIWENIVLNLGLTSKGIDLQSSSASSPLERSPSQVNVDLPLLSDAATPSNGRTATNGNNVPLHPTATGGIGKLESPRDWNASSLKHITQGLPNALAPFFQAMVKMFHARRNPDAMQKKQIKESSKIVADIMLMHLSLKDFDNKAALYNYYSVIFALFALLLIDERTTTNTLHTVELFAYYQANGFATIFDICSTLADKIQQLVNIKEDNRSETERKELLHAYGAIKVALHLIHPIVSSKPLFESGQTLLIVTRDKADTDPSYFEPHNFLVKLRSAALPTLRKLWEASWLIQAPLGVSRYVVRSVLEIVNGENEENKTEPNLVEVGPNPTILSRPSGPDESRIRILTDMGFPRSAAERALARTHNNVNSATELLLSNPFPLPPDPVQEPTPTVTVEPENPVPTTPPVEAQIEDQSRNEEAGGPLEPISERMGNPSPIPEPETEDTSANAIVPGKSADEWCKELDDARESLRASISRQSLLLIDEHLSLLFDLHIAFTKPSKHQNRAVRDLVDDIKAFSAFAYDVQEQPLANRCRLLALVLCEKPTSLDQDLRNTLMDHLLALLLSSINPEHPPRWLAAHLLVTEALFTLADEPRAISLPKEGEPIVTESISVGPPRTGARLIVFDFCLRLLAVDDLPTDELLSVLRLFVLLTRDRDMASQFVKRDGLVHLFKRLRNSSVTGGSSYVATILRHVVEDESTIQGIISQSIKRYFTQPRTRIVDIATFVRNCSSIALRDVDIFIDTTKSLCQLEQPYSSSPHIKLQNESTPVEKPSLSGPETSSDMQVDTPSNISSNVPQKSVESVMSLLITELMNTVKVVNETPLGSISASEPDQKIPQNSQPLEDIPGVPATKDGDVAPPPQVDVQDKYQYSCFLMQCLTELLFSYDACKIAFLTYTTKRRLPQSSKDINNKFRNATLHFLLSELVTYGTINSSSDSNQRSKGMLCSWAMNVIGALCMDTSSAPEVKDVSADLVFVRKFVLETISRSVKEVSSTSDNVESRYGRLLALADLCHRLLTVRVNPSSRKHQDDVPTHLAKIMLEKNFVAVLTTALSEVDLNYPNVRNLIAAILRPLEFLTKIAIKMSRNSNKSKEELRKDDSVSSESEEDDENMDNDGREETPDLYRNSALGMYAGEMDDNHYSEDEDMDEDEEDQDVEMEYGEETGSEDTSASESDGEEDDLDHATHDSGEVWDEGEDEDEEGLVENHEMDDDDDDEHDGEEDENEEDEGEDDEDDEGMIWEDMEDEADGLGLALDQVDESGHGVPIQVNHEEDEPEMASDEEEFVVDHGHFHNDGIFSFGEAFINAGARDLGGLFVHRRHRGNEQQSFGRTRSIPAAPETTTHPLLLDMSAANRANNTQNRGFRHAQRIISNGPPNLLQTIDEMLGEGSLQMLQQIISHEGGGAETFRIEVPAGTILQHSRRFLGASRTERVPRPQGSKQGREFDPLATLQRWAEEMKILHGDFVVERVGKLGSHLVLAMLPAAIEALKNTKLREEEEAKQRAEEEAKLEEEKIRAAQQPTGESTEVSAAPPQSLSTEQPAGQETEPSAGNLAEPILLDGPQEQSLDSAMSDAIPPDVDADMTDSPEIISPPPPPVEPEVNPEDESVAGPSTALNPNPPERVTVMIHGSAVDITDTGIDPTFLEALPDDMREEVLNQHVRDQEASRVERPPDSQISSEFLDALPPEIRAEIIQQEAMERARRRTEEASRPPAREPAEIDPASFIASLDPTLRQAVLLDQDDGFIQSLPSHMIAEAGAYRDELHGGRPIIPRNPARGVSSGTQARKYVPQHDAILLLDRPSVAVLVRLLFFPQVLKKTLLFKVLVNICENAKTRTDLFNILLGILQDGTADLAAVDKSFAQMSVRNRDTKPQTPKAAGKQRASSDYLSALALPTSQIETVPDLIAQRCLEALTYIVTTNELSSLFFLTEHDIPPGLRKLNPKKGKGKEKQSLQTHYPLVLLLNLLDRQSLLRTPAILESVVGLLATVTRPLTSLKDQTKVQEPVQPFPSALSTPAILPPEPISASDNISSPELPSTENNLPSTGRPSDSPAASYDPIGASKSATESDEKALLPHPPQIPNSTLRLIVNILTIGECSGRTFQQSLALIQHLSYIPDSRDVIAHELKAKAQEFGQTLYTDLDELVTALPESQSNLMINSVAMKFSPASSTQAKLLRVLKTIDYMYTPKVPSTGSAPAASPDDIEKVQAIYESFRFTPLWRRLGDCLSVIGENAETSQIATVLLPLIEALMVVCKFVGSKGPGIVPRAVRASTSPRSPTTPRESMEELFISFTDAHRKILNLMVRNNPSLMSGSFSLLVNNSRVLDFDNKRNYFNQQLHRKPHMREHYGTLQLNVRRARVFEDSFLYLQRKTGEQIKHGKLSVRFYDEEGVDAGGLTREWFQILARQMFNPNNALFQPCAADKLTYQPNKNSWVNPEHLSFFKFVGRVIGKAIYDGRLLDAYFARSLYRQLLGKPVDYKDVEWVDPEYYNSLCWILENDPTALDLTFSVEADEFGVNRIVPLKEGGETIPVTQENKREFVQLSAQYRLYSSIKDQIESLSNGFYEIIPKDLITIFNEQELELLISGTPDIDVDEWRAATEYNGYTSSDPNIVWWWRALKSFNREERAKVLSFATGTSRVPLSGFLDLQGVQGVQKFSIHRAYGEPDRLPQAHTCFNQIDLPQYTSYEMLRQQLLMAILEGGEGFAFS